MRPLSIQHTWFGSFIWLAALLPVLGCGSSGSDKGASAGPSDATGLIEKLDMDGFVLLVEGTTLRLFDPSTGKDSGGQWALWSAPRISDVVTSSPDGRRVAFSAPGSGSPTLVVADVVFEAGVPSLKTVAKFTGPNMLRPRFSSDGLRVFTYSSAVDVDNNQVWSCGGSPSGVAVLSAIVPIPGGHRYYCPPNGELKEDGNVLSSAKDVATPTADGQFLSSSLQAASGTSRPVVNAAVTPASDTIWRDGQRITLADAHFAVLARGINGKHVVEKDGGFVTLYEIVDVPALPGNGTLYDLSTAFSTGQWQSEGEWQSKSAFDAYLHDGVGRSWAPYAVSGDGQRALFGISSWNIGSDPNTNVLYEIPIASALVAVTRAGEAQGFKPSAVSDGPAISLFPLDRDLDGSLLFQPELLGDLGGVDFGAGDLLAPIGSSAGSLGIIWGGYLDGKPSVARNAGRMSRDGRWFFATNAPRSAAGTELCLREVRGKTAGCLVQGSNADALEIVGYGLKAEHAQDAPEVFGLSRSAVWSGAGVNVFGVRFGTSGTLSVGGTEVPSSAISEWTDTRISFTSGDWLSAAGKVVIKADAGEGGTRRAFWLHPTELIDTPFSSLPTEPIALGQGLNQVDLNGFEISASPTSTSNMTLTTRILPDAALSKGSYAVYSPGAAKDTVENYTLTSGAFTHSVYFHLENRIVDETSWQLVQPSGPPDTSSRRPQFVRVAGDIVEQSNQAHPELAERLLFGAAQTGSMPDFWREAADGKSAWVVNYVTRTAYSLARLTGFLDPVQPGWGYAQYAAKPRQSFGPFLYGVETDGNTLLLTGSDLLGTDNPGFVLSADGGVTLGKMTLVSDLLATKGGALREPVRVEAKAGTFFLVLQASLSAPSLFGIHAIDSAGTFTPDVASVPTGAQLWGGTVLLKAPLTYATHAGKVLLHFPLSNQLVATDFDDGSPAPHAWTPLPSASESTHVTSIWQDTTKHQIFAVMDDGSIKVAPEASMDSAAAWKPVDLGIELLLPTKVRPIALTQLEGGRWLVYGELNSGAKGASATAASPFGGSGFLLGPKP